MWPAPSPPHLHLTTSKVMVIVWRLKGTIIRTVLYIANVLPLQWAQLTKTVHTARLGHEFVFLCFFGCMICLYVHVCFVLPWSVESFPFMFWRWRNKLKWAPFEFFAPSPLLRVRSWLHPFWGHCEQQAMRDEEVIYVAGHPLLNRRCTRLPGCIRLRNDLYCVEWGVKLYSLIIILMIIIQDSRQDEVGWGGGVETHLPPLSFPFTFPASILSVLSIPISLSFLSPLTPPLLFIPHISTTFVKWDRAKAGR